MASVVYGPTGINFADSTAAGANMRAELLDSYEEGAWTSGFYGTGSNPTVSATAAENGNYTKIGEYCFCQWYLDVTINNVGSGNLQLGALPFTPGSIGSATPTDNWGMGVSVADDRPFIAHGRHPRIYSTTTKLGWLGNTSAAGWAWTTVNELTNSTHALSNGTIHYFV